MTGKSTRLSTFERSCQHWSAAARAEMDAFYRLATIDYRLLATEISWGRALSELCDLFGAQLRLLDVACGSGQFPRALQQHGGLTACHDLEVAYSLLDPSEFSIRTARQHLQAPFRPAEEYTCTIQAMPSVQMKYNVIWATHALYCVPEQELPVAFDRILSALDDKGLGFIAHASRESHYLRFHDLYLNSSASADAEPYCSGEQVIAVLTAQVDPAHLSSWTINYEGRCDLQDRDTVQGYLQRCLFDNSISLEHMLDDRKLGPYLRSCMDVGEGLWRFSQKVCVIFFGPLAPRVRQWRS